MQHKSENTQSNSEKVGHYHIDYKSKNSEIHDALFDQKLELATEGLEPYYLDHLRTRLSKENALIISKYILSMKVEVNLSSNHRRGIITSLKLLSEFLNNKSFKDVNHDDILLYLDSRCRKPESADTQHKWVTTYNQRLICFIRFFKWLYSPET